MATILDYLRQVPGDLDAYIQHLAGGGDPGITPAAFGYGVQPASGGSTDPWANGPPDLGAAATPATIPGVGGTQPVPNKPDDATPAAGSSILDRLPPISTGPPLPLSALPTASGQDQGPNGGGLPKLPPLPVARPRGELGDALDSIFLGGALQKHAASEYGREVANYNLIRNSAMLAQMSPEEQKVALLNPGKLGESEATNFAASDLAPGATRLPGTGGAPYTAPQFDPVSGKIVQPGPGGTMVDTPSAGGGYKAEGGIVVSDRTGDVANRYALPQVVAPGSHVEKTIPGVAPGASGAPALPRLPMEPPIPAASGGVPTPAQLPALLPGARLTSGLRTPAHNAAVGGVAGSHHLEGSMDAPGALDLVPAPGESMAAFQARVAAAAPDARILNEGNHLHIDNGARATAVPITAGPQTDATGSIIDQGAPAAPQFTAPTWNPRTGKFEQRNTATGEVSAGASPEFGVSQVLDMRDRFQKSDEMQKAHAAIYATNSLNDALSKATKNNGVLDMAAIMNLAKSETGGVPRQGQVKTLMDHFGMPQDIANKISSTVGDGALTPQSLSQVMSMMNSYATTARELASQRLANDEAFAKGHGQTLGLEIPAITPTPKVDWMGTAAAAGAPTPPPPVGFVSSKGYRFNGGDPHDGGNWTRVTGR